MSEPTRPTSIRHVILALTVVVAILLYLDRYCLGFVLTYIRANYRLSETQARFLVSAFFYTYAIGQIPCGWLSDRYGTRLMLSLYLAIWSTLTGLMGFAQGFVMLLMFRFGCGLFEAGAYPACAGLIRRWIPYKRRGLASGIISLGGRLGGTIAPPATAYLMILFMPLDASSLVTEHDLLDARKMAQDVLQPAQNSKISEPVRASALQLRSKMSERSRQLFQDIAELPQAATVSPEQVSAMIQAINGWLQQGDVLAGIDLTPLRSKLNRQGQALLDKPTAERSSEESSRLQRYLLEVLYPVSLRKIEGDSWQPVLMIYGSVGVLLALVFWCFYRDSPRQHILCNEAEAQLIEEHETATIAPALPLCTVIYAMLRSPGLWASGMVQFGTNFVWIFLGNEMPTYLQRVYEVPIETRGWMTFSAFFASLPMLLVGGWWTDRMTRNYGPYLGRCIPLATTRFIGAIALLTCWFLDAPWPITLALCVFSMASDTGLPAIWAYNLDVGGRNVGLILGWGNMIGNLGAAVSATILGYILKQYVDLDASYRLEDLKAGYGAVFVTCAGVFVVIGVLSFFVDATKTIGVPAATK